MHDNCGESNSVVYVCVRACVCARMIKRFRPHMGVYILADYIVAMGNSF